MFLLWDRFLAVDWNTGLVTPSLATSWETNEDATQWTFDIRQGVTFSDGAPLTAADILYTIERHIDPNLGSRMKAQMEEAFGPDGVEASDDYTVVFNLNSGNVDFPSFLTDAVFRIVPDGSGDSIHESGVGTGPFTLGSAVPDGISVFNARDGYWAGSPLLGKVTVVGITDSDARISATLAGQVDIAGQRTSITPAQASLFEGDPEFYVQESPKGQIQVIAMITTEPPFDDPLVRQALKLVVDPFEMIEIVAQGHGAPTCNNPAWPDDPYYLAQECPQDIERARELLAEAGYPDGLTIEFETANVNPVWIPIATVYKEQAALAGITVEINQVPSDGYWTNTWMVHPFGHSYWAYKPIDQFMSLAFRCGASYNETFWCNEEHDALQDQAAAELDFDARKVLYQQAQQLIADDGGMIAPFFMNFIRAINVRLQGIPELAAHNQFPYHEFRIIEP